jgi:phosphoribosylaminoimidazolecarboxamide formyltransferase/IMP cyclohydrolase/phosphoribosylaminoimidazolecarboxamide formyltransferase
MDDGPQNALKLQNTLKLRYGLNPHQAFAELRSKASPLDVLSGAPGYINLLDALRGWKLVRELTRRFAQPAAASFKHVNPAGAGLSGGTLDESYRRAHFLPDWSLSPLAVAYIRARQADRIASYGDFIALSDPVDLATALVIKNVASDGVIAPGFDPQALSVLRAKRDGRFVVLAVDPAYEPEGPEVRDEFGLTLVQDRDTSAAPILQALQAVTSHAQLDTVDERGLSLAMIVAKHTQSNAVVLTADDQTVGIGAGQQSRILSTRIACEKAETYLLYDHPRILDLAFKPGLGRIEKMNVVELLLRFDVLAGAEQTAVQGQLAAAFVPLTRDEKMSWLQHKRRLYLASDAAIPFRDNIDRAAAAGVTHVVQAGGSRRDGEVTAAADQYGMVMLHTGVRHFLH